MDSKPIERVQEIILDERLSISAFEKACGLSNNSIQTAIKRKSNLKDETINSILNAFPRYNPTWILTGKGSKLVDNVLASDSKNHNNYGSTPVVITVDSHNEDNIVLVPMKAQAGYIKGWSNPNFIKKLPTFRMPGLNNGVFRMFEVSGNSMFPTLPDRSYVVGSFVENWVKDIKDNRLYVIVSNKVEDGLVKRCINKIEKYNNLICKSDNRREYPTQSLHPDDILEVWEVKLHLNFNIPDPADIYDRVNDLEGEVISLKEIVKKAKLLP
ncbi:transcriptional regulator [Chryseobacterium sp. 6424]|uniref:S24 family peptidase n=1 Tax=Chryseobacterium sp. 6424 TaxID=2039166 RepID=UPI000EFCF5B2|nr:helix-turn-helix transcriptional regulator [Chryseobacterium sp. 6424]AYO58220.1 transcriptional regulator [Chryseobacterium sp. 6424]